MNPSQRVDWNLFIETFPREKLRQVQIKNFRSILRRAKTHFSFYRRRYSHHAM